MYKHLTSLQRSQIFAYKQCNKSPKFIAEALGVHISTIYRELSRNKNKRGGYAHNAHEMAMERQERIVKNATIKSSLKFECLHRIRTEEWSPEQIAGKMRLEGKNVSHTTIYKWIKEDKRAVGISAFKQKIARKTGIPTTRQGLERKIGGAILGAIFGKKRR